MDQLVILDQASGYLQIDMLEAYAKKYKHRAIIAGTVVERGTPLANDVKWHKIIAYQRGSSFKRIYTWSIATIQMWWLLLTKYRKAHVLAITNPPFSVFVPWVLGCSYDVLIYDLYPDALSQYGYLKPSGIVFKLWSSLNRKVFKKARKIYALTEGMKTLASKYAEQADKIEVIPLWSDDSDFKEVNRNENKILEQTSTQDKFTIVYSGNLGLTHPLERLIFLAEGLDPERFAVLIIGDGAKKKQILELVKLKNLPHVHFLPWQPIELLSHNLYAANLSVVSLDEEASDLSIPSKTFNILTIGNPILGLCSKKSGLAELIVNHKCGVISESDNDISTLEFIKELSQNEEMYNSFKSNSLAAAKSFTKRNALAFVN